MPPVDRPFESEQHTGTLKLAVALLPAAGTTVVKGLTGTTCADYKPQQQYHTKAGKPAHGITQDEYMDFIRGVLAAHTRRRASVIWVHDRDPSHRTPQVQRLLESEGQQVMLLPPRSPDLDPLDYAVFAHSKGWLERNMPPSRCSWEQRCKAFVQHLEQLDPQRQVEGYIKRLEMVVAEEGGHIEHKIKRA